MPGHLLYCSVCGAANNQEHTTCFVCHHPLTTGEEASEETLLHGRYRLLAQIGGGGFGVVYRAQDISNAHELVAIKQIKLSGLSTQQIIEATETFNRERVMLAALDYPRLPHLRDTFEDSEHWYLVMDYFAGKTLEHYLLEREHSLSASDSVIDEALHMGLQVCDILHYLHSRTPPVIFRDLKPSNIIRRDDSSYALVDFGIARHFKRASSRDTIPFGSPGYAAPEQYGRAQTDARADIYSLGVILHQMISGIDPTEAPLQFTPLSLSGPSLKSFEQLISHMVELQVDKRPASIAQVADRLREIQQERRGVNQRIWDPKQPPPPLDQLDRGDLPLYTPSGSAPGLAQQQMQMVHPQQKGRRIFLKRGIASIALAGVAGLVLEQGVEWWKESLSNDANDANLLLKHLVQEHRLASPIYQMSWSPDGNKLALAMNATVKILQPATSKKQSHAYQLPELGAQALSWSPDGDHLALSNDIDIQVWSMRAKKVVATYSAPKDEASKSSSIVYLAWSPDGQKLAAAHNGGSIKIWDVTQKKLHLAYQPSSEHSHLWLSWSPDGKYIVSGRNSGHISVWDTRNGNTLFQKDYHVWYSYPPMAAWSPGGSRLAVLAQEDIAIEVVDSQSGQRIFLCEWLYGDSNAALGSITWSPDGQYIAAHYMNDTKHTIQFWHASTGKQAGSYDASNTPFGDRSSYPEGLLWSPNSRFLVNFFQDKDAYTIQVLKAPEQKK
ncbi:hypothetical protein EPA93_36885 [Ktedonosporobacter rubrisoli]|uniref:non-specific serine/threonine protein kinase n=1 Tax=Ktedonosporobacter rubrisoli TaxID=2509675 RepID=A0A4P6JZK6_KTERU|nr:WD40 repeat domain-containing serine/threonine protein kinase [Ktedonosporobacter rubrisoli]QBD81257.1 hypothetical protein EPA93_36885 [Ktedonosporobacter rubrisoli]